MTTGNVHSNWVVFSIGGGCDIQSTFFAGDIFKKFENMVVAIIHGEYGNLHPIAKSYSLLQKVDMFTCNQSLADYLQGFQGPSWRLGMEWTASCLSSKV